MLSLVFSQTTYIWYGVFWNENVAKLFYLPFFRFVALDLILVVEDVLPTNQDKNNASFNVITDGRVYELMARDEEEKEK